MTDWILGQYVRVWRSGSIGEHDAGGYEYGHIETLPTAVRLGWTVSNIHEVMLVGDDGREIYCRVKDLEEG